MTDTVPVSGAEAPAHAVIDSENARSSLSELRALKRAGLGTDLSRVRELLAGFSDPFDVEAAGRLISTTQQSNALAASGAFRQTRIAFLGSSTLDALPPLAAAVLARDGVLAETRSAGFNQWRLEILNGAPGLGQLRPRLVSCLLDDEAVFGTVTDPLDIAAVELRCAEFAAELGAWAGECRRILGGIVVLNTVPLGPLRRAHVIDYQRRARLAAAWHRMNGDVLTLASGEGSGIVVVDSAGLDTPAVCADSRMRHIAGHAFAPGFLLAYAEELARVARADLGLSRKCLVLDLDNTLWGGVVGDDGVDGIRLGGGHPGSAFRELQQMVRGLKEQGVLLAVSSKNDPGVCEEAFATHPEMLLTVQDFVAVRANWRSKPENVVELAQQINISTDAMVFVDDNPAERDLMRRALPEVTTLEMPDDPSDFALIVARSAGVDLLQLTEEDSGRVEMYRAQADREQLRLSEADLTTYLHDLHSELRIEPVGPLNVTRVVQLFAKTNQFNLTGRRYSEDEIARNVEQGGAFYAARLTDRFGDNGLIAAIGLTGDATGVWSIDNIVMSCRVFSRGVERAIVGSILRAARRHGAPAVTGVLRETAKNAKFAAFYPEAGFAEIGTAQPPSAEGRRFQHTLQELVELPAWIRIAQGEETFDEI
jgi:FkbH-like protein